jgi:hypothetical protein
MSLNYKQYSNIADLQTFQFTAAHALGFSVFPRRIWAKDLSIGTLASNQYEVLLSNIGLSKIMLCGQKVNVQYVNLESIKEGL